MAGHAQASTTPLLCLSLCLLLLPSAQRATGMYLDADGNHETFSGGTVPESFSVRSRNSSNSSGAGAAFCRLLSLQILDLSNNQLTGELPDCWWNLQALQFMDLSNNSFSGQIPAAKASHNCSIESLHLAGNSFTGLFPPVVEGCDSLGTLDIGSNRFFGAIPPWIGTKVPSLRILSLRSNDFTGEIPSELSRLSKLQLLDLANNRLTGAIPVAFGNLASMRNPEIVSSAASSLDGSNYQDRIDIIWKGQELIFQRTIRLLTGIDLSGNMLSQCIPEVLTKLQGLRFLNLSRNHLSCGIPQDIGSLKNLEFLDISWNELSGHIPQSISILSTLSIFNISNNHLSGKIPTGSQMQTLTDPSFYRNNSGLCGFPLEDCPNTSPASDEKTSEGEDQWLYYCVTAGVVFGFWLWFGLLFSIETWRSAVLFSVDGMQSKVMQKVSHLDQFISKSNNDRYT
ncbi:receptor-like protein EIX2 [Hordeum vulgare subsp. vulgare]|uniref:Predicted protein n=1 Tax=Hordeum vulgare subsp. vulgare TaxID=112509 RepID=F2CWF8_HORVV|nr:receptor-like protein EIX2 [Hordeum vulgare subsp. vulgare]BAJ87179.1 predicted protein [Hordeum vulgare subsp. vulgare]BAJ94896.1 predicted protein [Hordeum vulgare subsp. vulgare]